MSDEAFKMKNFCAQRYRSTQTCHDCGETDWILLESDHTRDDKATRQSTGLKIRTITKQPTLLKVALEVLKCETVCVMCHRRRTHARHTHTTKGSIKRLKKERHDFVNQKKVEIGKCSTCPLKVDVNEPFLFDWDHINPETKTKSISDMCGGTFPMKQIEAEIAKCRLLCCKCHRRHTRITDKWTDFTQATVEQLAKVDETIAKAKIQHALEEAERLANPPPPREPDVKEFKWDSSKENLCTRCETIKPLDQFYRYKETYQRWCKKCKLSHMKENPSQLTSNKDDRKTADGKLEYRCTKCLEWFDQSLMMTKNFYCRGCKNLIGNKNKKKKKQNVTNPTDPIITPSNKKRKVKDDDNDSNIVPSKKQRKTVDV